MKKQDILKTLFIIAILAVPAIVLAQNPVGPIEVVNPGLPNPPVSGSAKDLLIGIIQKWLLPFAGIIAVLFIIIGGFQYIFAGANPKLAEQGKSTLKNAVIGLVIIILSYAIITVVVNTLFNL